MGLVLTGDFMQLPPVKAEWAFKADCWPEFDKHTTRLTKCWRQSDQRFLEAINLIRRGDGVGGARLLKDIGVQFAMSADQSFDGTTIIAKNDQVDRYNFTAHSKVQGVLHRVCSSRWGKVRSEWSQIPPDLGLKNGALVMILTNDTPLFTYVNGDCGHVEGYELNEVDGGEHFAIKLKRTGEVVDP